MHSRFFPLVTSFVLLGAASLSAAELTLSIEKTPSGGVTIKAGGQPFATYVIDQVNKPYLWPIYGPTGKAMTRAYPMLDVPGEQHDHPHHRGITFGMESAGGGAWSFPQKWDGITGEEKMTGGGDTWHEARTFEEMQANPKSALRGKQRLGMLARIVHREFTELKVDGDKAVVAEICDYLDASGKRFLTEERRLTFRASADSRSIDVDQDLIASDGPIKIDDRKDAGLGIRLPSSMAVESKTGGEIVNSEGIKDVAAWGKKAKWCDYHGPVEGEALGVAMLSHPSTYRFPTQWHVRPYGLFSANPFGARDMDKSLPDGTTSLQNGERVKLRHRILFHKGDAAEGKVEAAFEAYAKESN
jgi:hypothetical protein